MSDNRNANAPADFRVVWSGAGASWVGLQRLALHNPPGSAFDEGGHMLRDSTDAGLPGILNFQCGSDRLFGPEAYPYHASLLEFAVEMTKLRTEFRKDSNERAFRFRPMDSSWVVEFRRHGDHVELTANAQTQQLVRCPTTDFMAGIEAFLDEFVPRLFEKVPLAFEWHSLTNLNRYLHDKLSQPGPHADHGSPCRFVWSPREVDWERVATRRRLNPPGSTYDAYGEAATELFGAPMAITLRGEPIRVEVPLRFWGAWRLGNELRRGKGREIGTTPFLLDGEPWPLLDLGLQLARSVRSSSGGYRTATGVPDSDSRRLVIPGTRAYSPVIDPAFVRQLEGLVGPTQLLHAARDFLQTLIRETYFFGGGAASWDSLRSIRAFAF